MRKTANITWLCCFVLMAFAGCKQPVRHFAAGVPRNRVIEIMGKPSNVDHSVVAVWTFDDKRSQKSWREICDDGRDAVLCIFNEADQSILPSLAFSATTISTKMTDGEVVEWAKELKKQKAWK
jgi:hypothetical protein